jgi:excisionase family DNA binding protein
VARLLNVSLAYVYKLVHNGDLPFFRIGRAMRIRQADFDRYVLNQAFYQRVPAKVLGKKK